jgi:hypothetical protein
MLLWRFLITCPCTFRGRLHAIALSSYAPAKPELAGLTWLYTQFRELADLTWLYTQFQELADLT